jgi:hypothetical protein
MSTAAHEPVSDGLRLDQAPPLSIPFSFFAAAPLFLLAAGALLLWSGQVIVLSRYMPQTIALTHLVTLGVLSTMIFGSLYQMAPVVAASPVQALGFSRVVIVALVLGVASFVFSLLGAVPIVMYGAMAALSVAWLGFLWPVGVALLRSPAGRDPTVQGMRLALAAALVVWFFGVWMAHGHSAGRFPGPRAWFMSVHLGLALLCFVGCLIVAVSFQVLPMFYLVQAPTLPRRRALIGCCGASALVSSLLLAASMLTRPEQAARIAALLPYVFLPAALAVWILHPAWTLRALSARKRRRRDATLDLWTLGLGLGPVTFGLALASALGDDPRLELGFGFVALFGWALSIVHGMLYRIGPFLIWFHRLSPWVGIAKVPPASKLLPERELRAGFWVHVALLACGAAAVVLRSGLLARLTGLLVCVLAGLLVRGVWALLRYRPPAGLAPR